MGECSEKIRTALRMDTELKTFFRLDDEITLRAWEEADVEHGFETVMRNRGHLQAFMHWMTPDYSMESARKFNSEAIKKRKSRESLGLGIYRGKLLIGSIGFVGFDWKARKTDIGYWLVKEEEGKGIITRATRMLIGYAFDELELNRIEIQCSSQNLRSAAVPERLGFKKEGVLRQAEFRNGQLRDFSIYGLLAQDRERV